jgi:hypothetical protein
MAKVKRAEKASGTVINTDKKKAFIVNTTNNARLNVRDKDNKIVRSLVYGAKIKGVYTEKDLVQIDKNEFVKKQLVKEI